MLHANRWLTMAAMIAGLLLAACGVDVEAAETSEPAYLEATNLAGVDQVTLISSAAERLDIQTAPVRVEEVVRTWVVGGQVVADSGAGNAIWVGVTLSPGEMAMVERDKAAQVRAIDSGGAGAGVTAEPVDGPGGEADRLYYAIDGTNHGLTLGQRVLVELVLSSGQVRTVIPYAALIYGVDGDTWTYTNEEPLSYVRYPVTVDYIDGDTAVLLDGPEAGVEVVTVGAAELLGVEFGLK